MAALFKVQHLAPAETQRLDESEWVDGWAAAHNGRIKTQHQFGSEGIAGQSMTECRGAPSPSLGTSAGQSVAFVGVSYDLCWRCDCLSQHCEGKKPQLNMISLHFRCSSVSLRKTPQALAISDGEIGNTC